MWAEGPVGVVMLASETCQPKGSTVIPPAGIASCGASGLLPGKAVLPGDKGTGLIAKRFSLDLTFVALFTTTLSTCRKDSVPTLKDLIFFLIFIFLAE